MTAAQLVPGISQFPELEAQLNQRMTLVGVSSKCSSCAYSRVAREFRHKLNTLVERDKLTRRR